MVFRKSDGVARLARVLCLIGVLAFAAWAIPEFFAPFAPADTSTGHQGRLVAGRMDPELLDSASAVTALKVGEAWWQQPLDPRPYLAAAALSVDESAKEAAYNRALRVDSRLDEPMAYVADRSMARSDPVEAVHWLGRLLDSRTAYYEDLFPLLLAMESAGGACARAVAEHVAGGPADAWKDLYVTWRARTSHKPVSAASCDVLLRERAGIVSIVARERSAVPLRPVGP